MMFTRILVKVLWKWLKNVMSTNVQCGQRGVSGQTALPLVVGARGGNTGSVWITRVDWWTFQIVQDLKACPRTATLRIVLPGQIGRFGPNVLQLAEVDLEAELESALFQSLLMPDLLLMTHCVLENLNSLKSVPQMFVLYGQNGLTGLNVQPLVGVGCKKESETASCPKILVAMIMAVWVNLGK